MRGTRANAPRIRRDENMTKKGHPGLVRAQGDRYVALHPLPDDGFQQRLERLGKARWRTGSPPPAGSWVLPPATAVHETRGCRGTNAEYPQTVDEGVDDMTSTEPSGLLTGAERLWNACAGSLRERLTDATSKPWFEGLQASALTDRRLVLSVPSSLVKERIAGRYLEELRGALADAGADTY